MSATGMAPIAERDVLLSGGAGKNVNSARAGFLPVSLERVPVGALAGIGVFVRPKPGQNLGETEMHGQFALYCAPELRFTEMHRRRLMDHGVKFIYIKIADQSRFRTQTEQQLEQLAIDPAVAVAEKSAIVYETSVELVNELLSEPEGVINSPRIEKVSRAITTLVMNNDNAFTHLFAASHHDFYTATHMVNVATWMVPLAYALGHRDQDELNHICQAGLLHDMGKVQVPEAVLNKAGKLSDDDWAQIRKHPEAGVEYLKNFDGVHPLVLTVALQHHERLDGTGYPHRLTDKQIDPISKICAVVDSFDAMTAFRPFKERTLGVDQALEILKKETPAKYDPQVLEAWISLLNTAERIEPPPAAPLPAQSGLATLVAPKPAGSNQRKHDRQKFHCPARAHMLTRTTAGVEQRPAIAVVAHSISRGGLGFLTQTRIEPGEYLRVYLQAKGWENRCLEGQTVRCRAYDDRWFEMGFEFSPLDVEAIQWKSAGA
jgi:HD-GYP domain-containing protein (c-di-GMP phosphodiesterase class II)